MNSALLSARSDMTSVSAATGMTLGGPPRGFPGAVHPRPQMALGPPVRVRGNRPGPPTANASTASESATSGGAAAATATGASRTAVGAVSSLSIDTDFNGVDNDRPGQGQGQGRSPPMSAMSTASAMSTRSTSSMMSTRTNREIDELKTQKAEREKKLSKLREDAVWASQKSTASSESPSMLELTRTRCILKRKIAVVVIALAAV
jgi:hypothetical protein